MKPFNFNLQLYKQIYICDIVHTSICKRSRMQSSCLAVCQYLNIYTNILCQDGVAAKVILDDTVCVKLFSWPLNI